jgi:phosphatidylglycerol lysyltransferase
VAALALLVQLLGTALGVGFVALVAITGGQWGAQLRAAVAVGPTPLAIGCALAVSAGLTALWRRRLRVLLLVGLAMLVLYSGLLADVFRLACGLVGLLVGAVWLGRARRRGGRTELSAPSRRETRVLVALVVAASALGPLIAVLAETRVGPLSVLRFVFASPPPDAATVDQLCADPAVAADGCRELRARLRLSGVGPGVMSVMPVLLLLVAAEGLRRGRRAAWLAALVLNLGLAVLGAVLAAVTAATPAEQRIVLGPGVHLHSWLALGLPALQPLLVALLLVAVRDRFPARARPGTYRRWGRVVGLGAVAVSVGYVLGSTLVADQYVPPPGVLDLVADLPTRFLPPGYLGEFERGDGFRGVMEFLIASAALHAQEDGAEFLSLSGAPLARLDRGEPGDGLQRLLDLAGRSLEPVYGFRSLLAFKAKFQPEFRPLFLAYPDPAALPRIGTAIGRAYLPDVGPRQFGRLVRRVMR